MQSLDARGLCPSQLLSPCSTADPHPQSLAERHAEAIQHADAASKIYAKLRMKEPEQPYWLVYGVFTALRHAWTLQRAQKTKAARRVMRDGRRLIQRIPNMLDKDDPLAKQLLAWAAVWRCWLQVRDADQDDPCEVGLNAFEEIARAQTATKEAFRDVVTSLGLVAEGVHESDPGLECEALRARAEPWVSELDEAYDKDPEVLWAIRAIALCGRPEGASD